VENEDAEDVEVEVDDDPTLEAEEDVEEEPLASSTPRRGHLPRPLVRYIFDFLIRIQGTSNKKIYPVLSCAISYKLRSDFNITFTLCFYKITLPYKNTPF